MKLFWLTKGNYRFKQNILCQSTSGKNFHLCIEHTGCVACDLAIHIEANAVCTDKMLTRFYCHLMSHTRIIIKKHMCTHQHTCYVFCVCILKYINVYMYPYVHLSLAEIFKNGSAYLFWRYKGELIFSRKYWVFLKLLYIPSNKSHLK